MFNKIRELFHKINDNHHQLKKKTEFIRPSDESENVF